MKDEGSVVVFKQAYQMIGIVLLYSFVFLCCSPAYKTMLPAYEKEVNIMPVVPDYSNLACWASHPLKKDPADSMPSSLQNEQRDTVADVFFVHPTTFTSNETKGVVWNANLNDAELNLKTDYSSILYQASVFNQHCRIFAPRYRQAHIYSFFTNDTATARKALDTAYEDVKKAFDYYLAHYNHGRPIIIASHSQGTYHCLRLLKEYFENKPLQHQLVCAYLVGFIIPNTYYTSLQPCVADTSTSCFVGWRTFKNGYLPSYVKKENNSCIVINPLSWTADKDVVSRKENKGSLYFDYQKIYPQANSAKISDGVVWTNRPRFPFSFLLLSGKKNYHVGDINIYYMSLRENVEKRIEMFLKRS